jgi:hypothetical protein
MKSHAMSGSASSQCNARWARHGARREVGEDRALAAALEPEAQQSRFADGATFHLRRLVAVGGKLRRCEGRRPLDRAHQAGCLFGD